MLSNELHNLVATVAVIHCGCCADLTHETKDSLK